MFRPQDFFNVADWEHRELFSGVDQVWEILPRIKPYLQSKISFNVDGIRLRRSFFDPDGRFMAGPCFGKGLLPDSR